MKEEVKILVKVILVEELIVIIFVTD